MASPVCSNGNSTFASTVHQGSSAKSWNTKVSGLRLLAGGAPRSSAAPALGRSKPPRICSSVLLPQPDGPTIATTSPERTVNDTLSSTSSAPKRWLIWSAIRSIWGSVFEARFNPSCPGLSRASTSERYNSKKDVDGRERRQVYVVCAKADYYARP